MALAKPASLVGAISGTLGGVNFVNSRFGLTLRSPRSHPPPPTHDQKYVGRVVILAGSWWNQITEAQRDAWRAAAENTLFTNRLGVNRNITAQQLFIRFNFQSAAFGLPMIDEPPGPWPFSYPSDFVLTVTAGLSAIIAPLPAYIPGGIIFLVAGARPMTTHAINHFHRWCIIGPAQTIYGGTIDCLSDFQARFGTIQQGERIGIRILHIAISPPEFTWIQHATTVL